MAVDTPVISTGSSDFSAGVDSLKVPTQQSPENPNGLTANQLAWLINATVRDGGISPRDGWKFKGIATAGIGPQVIPGAPAQTEPQPPVQVQTPAQQFIAGGFIVPAVNGTVTVSTGTLYVGNVGDVQIITADNHSVITTAGTFIITAITPSSVTIQTVSSGQIGNHVGTVLDFNLQSLGPPVPQPPVVIPPGPPTVLPFVPWYQGNLNPLYTPAGPDSFSSTGKPYGICVLGGHVIAYDPDFLVPPVDLSAVWGLYHPSDTPRCYFLQAETYVIIQAGDYDPGTGDGTLPLFWDGFELKRSNGITGVLSVGEPIPTSYSITNSAAWALPAATDSVVVQLTAPYPGNLGDNLAIEVPATSAAVGTARIVGISGNSITLLSIVQTDAATWPAQTAFAVTLTTPLTSIQTVSIGVGNFTIPAVGSQVKINMTSLYFGSVGDTIQITNISDPNFANIYGTFRVVSFNNLFQLVLQTLAPATSFTSTVVNEGNLLVKVTGVRAFTQIQPVDGAGGAGRPFLIPAVGGTISLYWPAFDGTWEGHLYDILNISQNGVSLGTFQVVAQGNYFNGNDSYPYITVETLASNFVGNSYNGPLSMTVTLPLNNPQYMTVNAGQWTMPDAGSSIQLQLIWQGSGDTPPEGPAYPGNVGDTVTLVNQSPAVNIGQFLVTAFDDLGNITLRVVQPTNGFTNVAPGTVFVGPTSATMSIVQVPSTSGTLINQIPAATAMAYWGQRVWYALGKTVSYGDIVGSLSGTAANGYRDAVLAATQNPFILGGDGFSMPSGNDNITGLAIPQMINASLGQGLLNIGTANGVFALQAPANQQGWDSLTATNPPQIFVVQQSNGFSNDWCVASVNGDLWFQSYAADIRSLLTAVRYFQQWGNVSLSSNEQRILQLVNTALLAFASDIYFNNRVLNTTYPQTTAYGAVHPALIPLDLTAISTLEQQDPPNWEGAWEGLQIMQLLTGVFGNAQRAFAFVLSPTVPGQMEIWENVTGQVGDIGPNGASRIQWQAETCSFTWGELFKLKQLEALEMWIDNIQGVLDVEVDYRPDGSSCWFPWGAFSVCTETTNNTTYPPTILSPGSRKPLVLGKPPQACAGENSRPSSILYEAQLRLTFRGQGRLRGFKIHGTLVKRPLFEGLIKTISSWSKSVFQSIFG